MNRFFGSLDSKTVDLLRIAFMVISDGKDASFWFNKATEHWDGLHGAGLSDENLNDVYEYVSIEFPELAENVQFRCWSKNYVGGE